MENVQSVIFTVYLLVGLFFFVASVMMLKNMEEGKFFDSTYKFFILAFVAIFLWPVVVLLKIRGE